MKIHDLHFKNQIWEMNPPTIPYLMGIINLTPDSFYDGGKLKNNYNFERKLEELAPVVDLVDVGGESSRPGADEVQEEEEKRRILSRITWIKKKYPKLVVSVDTYKVGTAKQAILAGADIINDISAGDASDNKMLELVKENKVPIILMHMKGSPKTMQKNIFYNQVVEEVCRYFEKKIELLKQMNFSKNKIIIDPGIGFGKYLVHNLELISSITQLKRLSYPVLIGASRKKMIGELCDKITSNRIYGSIGVHLAAINNGANIIRVHDAVEMRSAMKIFLAATKK